MTIATRHPRARKSCTSSFISGTICPKQFRSTESLQAHYISIGATDIKKVSQDFRRPVRQVQGVNDGSSPMHLREWEAPRLSRKREARVLSRWKHGNILSGSSLFSDLTSPGEPYWLRSTPRKDRTPQPHPSRRTVEPCIRMHRSCCRRLAESSICARDAADSRVHEWARAGHSNAKQTIFCHEACKLVLTLTSLH